MQHDEMTHSNLLPTALILTHPMGASNHTYNNGTPSAGNPSRGMSPLTHFPTHPMGASNHTWNTFCWYPSRGTGVPHLRSLLMHYPTHPNGHTHLLLVSFQGNWSAPLEGTDASPYGCIKPHIEHLLLVSFQGNWSAPLEGTDASPYGCIKSHIKHLLLVSFQGNWSAPLNTLPYSPYGRIKPHMGTFSTACGCLDSVEWNSGMVECH